jgi:adenosine deaminase CECR1
MVAFETTTKSLSNLQQQRLSNHQVLNHGASSLHLSSPTEYGKALKILYHGERDSAFDAAAIASASATERDAAAIVETIRQKERTRLKPVASDHFLGLVDHINNGSDLLRVTQRLPKGAHLHCHFNTYLHPSFLISQARHVECMFIRSSRSLGSPQSYQDAAITFSVLPKATERFNIFDPLYKPFGWMQYCEFLINFPGGMEEAETWLADKMVITEEGAHATHQTFDGYTFLKT